MIRLLLVLLMISLPSFAKAQCVNGRCPAVISGRPATAFYVTAPAPIDTYEWRPEEAGKIMLLLNGRHIGDWIQGEGYMEANGRKAAPPVSPPDFARVAMAKQAAKQVPEQVSEKKDPPLFGVDTTKLGASESYRVNGQPASKSKIYDILTGGGRLDDDSGLQRITVIGTPDECSQVMRDLSNHPALAEMKGRFLVRDFRPSHWAVKDAGFDLDSHPAIYCQSPDGNVLHRQDGYDGPEKLAEALRKADPKYDPKLDKDLRKPIIVPRKPGERFWYEDVPVPFFFFGAFVLLVILVRVTKK